MSTGIFLAGRGGMIPQGSLAQELLPKQELDGDKPSAESKGIWFFFFHGKRTPGCLSVWEPSSRGHLGWEWCLWYQQSCSGITSWRIPFYFPRNALEGAAFQTGAEKGKSLGTGQTLRSVLQSISEGCAISCLCLQHSRNILKEKSQISHDSLLYWESTRQRNGGWRNLDFIEILQETSISWQWYPHGERKGFPDNLGILKRSSMSG